MKRIILHLRDTKGHELNLTSPFFQEEADSLSLQDWTESMIRQFREIFGVAPTAITTTMR